MCFFKNSPFSSVALSLPLPRLLLLLRGHHRYVRHLHRPVPPHPGATDGDARSVVGGIALVLLFGRGVVVADGPGAAAASGGGFPGGLLLLLGDQGEVGQAVALLKLVHEAAAALEICESWG